EEPEDRTFPDNFDTDFCMNVGVYGTWFGDKDLDQVSQVGPYGYLMKDVFSTSSGQPGASGADDLVIQGGFPLTGYNAGGAKYAPYYRQPLMQSLHVEFEGAGISPLRDWLLALIALLLVAEALSAACSAGVVWACVVLFFLAFLIPLALAPIAI